MAWRHKVGHTIQGDHWLATRTNLFSERTEGSRSITAIFLHTIHVKGGCRIFQGERGCWCLGVAESMGHLPKMLQFENWNKTIALETLAMPQSTNYRDKVAVRTGCLYFCYNIYFSKRGWLPILFLPSPPPPPISPLYVVDWQNVSICGYKCFTKRTKQAYIFSSLGKFRHSYAISAGILSVYVFQSWFISNDFLQCVFKTVGYFVLVFKVRLHKSTEKNLKTLFVYLFTFLFVSLFVCLIVSLFL